MDKIWTTGGVTHSDISGVSCSWATQWAHSITFDIVIIRSSVYYNRKRWTMMYDKPASSQSVSCCAVATAMQEIRRRRALQLPTYIYKDSRRATTTAASLLRCARNYAVRQKGVLSNSCIRAACSEFQCSGRCARKPPVWQPPAAQKGRLTRLRTIA